MRALALGMLSRWLSEKPKKKPSIKHPGLRRMRRLFLDRLEDRTLLTGPLPAGSLDPNFNSPLGFVTTDLGAPPTVAGVAVQPSGKIVVAGYSTSASLFLRSTIDLLRYKADGSIDNTFGTRGNGEVVTDLNPNDPGSRDQAHALTVQPDGRIVVVGQAPAPEGSSTPGFINFGALPVNLNVTETILLRYLADGQLDSSFGTGGVVWAGAVNGSNGQAVALEADGKIVIGGTLDLGAGQSPFVARFNTNGTLDTGFASGSGFMAVNAGSGPGLSSFEAMSVDAHDRILVADEITSGSTGSSVLLRLTPGGSSDATFGQSGQAAVNNPIVAAVALDHDQPVILARQTSTLSGNFAFGVLRYTDAGAVDANFNGGQFEAVGVSGQNVIPRGVAVQADHKIVVAGYSVANFDQSTSFALGRVNADGSVDTSFGSNGVVTTNLVTSPANQGEAVAIQTDGNILVAGEAGALFAVARYLGGTPSPPPFIPPPTASISGTVFHDVDANGVNDGPAQQENPLGSPTFPRENWQVYLDLNHDGRLDPGDPSTLTSPDGTYHFAGLPAGDYAVNEREIPTDTLLGRPISYLAIPRFATQTTTFYGSLSALAAGDFTGSGQSDLVASIGDATPLFFRQADGSLASATTLPGFDGVAVADFNHDGHLDLAGIHTSSHQVVIYQGVGNRAFDQGTPYDTGNPPISVTAVDINGDGWMDLVLTTVDSQGAATISIMLNQRDGTFAAPRAIPVQGRPTVVVAGDFNNDGRMDLAALTPGGLPMPGIAVLLQNADGSFQAPVYYHPSSHPSGLAVGDFNGDHNLDLAVTDSAAGTVTLLLGDGQGNFTAGTPIPAGPNPNSVAAVDLNGDQVPDLAIAGSQGVTVLLGVGDGTFQQFHGAAGLSSLNAPLIVATTLANGTKGIAVVGQPDPQNVNAPTIEVLEPSGGQSQAVHLDAGASATQVDFANYFGNGGSIRGKIFNDFNGNGRLDANEPGLANWTVYLGGNGNGRLDLEPFTTTDALGNYEFRNLVPWVGSPQFPSYTVGPVVPSGYTYSPPQGLPMIFVGVPVQPHTATTRNFGYVPAAVLLQGSVFVDTNGNGIRDPGEPGVPNVQLFIDANHDGRPDNGEQTTTTDANGNYVFPNPVTPGRAYAVSGVLSPSAPGLSTIPAALESPEKYRAGTNPAMLATADFNRDGFPDVAVANAGSNSISILFNQGDGSFAAPVNIDVGTDPVFLVAADLTGNGLPDLVVVNQGSGSLTILLNDPAHPGHFSSQPVMVGGTPMAVAVGDLNHDGLPDLAVADATSQNITVLFNGVLGQPGSFSAAHELNLSIPGDLPASGIVIADLNNDGNNDLAVSTSAATGHFSLSRPSVHVYFNTGDASSLFGTPMTVSFPDSFSSSGLVATDWNRNGVPDLVVATDAYIELITYDSQNGFATQPIGGSHLGGNTILPGEFIVQPGVIQLAIAAPLGLYLLDHNGHETGPFLSATSVSGIAAADFDGDGTLDLVVIDDSFVSEPSVVELRNQGNGNFTSGPVSVREVFVPLPGMGATSNGDIPLPGIQGTVYEDTNGNGRRDPGEQGVPNQRVFLDLNHDGVRQPNEPEAITAANGSYSFLASGRNYDVTLESDPHWRTTAPAGSELRFTEPFPLTVNAFGYGPAATGDLNGDGYPDLVASFRENDSYSRIKVMLDDPTAPGSFSSGWLSPQIPGQVVALKLADVNGDGLLDLVVLAATSLSITGTLTSETVLLFLNNPMAPGTFLPATTLATATLLNVTEPPALEVADLNGDGLPDIVYLGPSSVAGVFQLFMLLNNRAAPGTFLPSPITATGHFLDLKAVDLSGDGATDLIASTAQNVIAFRNDPTHPGTFHPVTIATAPPGFEFHSFTLADLNRDGLPDLAVYAASPFDLAHPAPQSVQLDVYLNDPNAPGTLLAPTTYALGMTGGQHPLFDTLTAVDWNRDGLLDLAVRDPSQPVIDFLLNDPGHPGSFRAPIEVNVLSYNLPFLIGDFNRDGLPDLVVTGTDTLAILGPSPLPLPGQSQYPDRYHIYVGKRTVSQSVSTSAAGIDFGIQRFPDSNGDGIPDYVEALGPGGPSAAQQPNVASLPNTVDGHYVTLTAPPGTQLTDVQAIANPSPNTAPAGAVFPFGFLNFTLRGIAPGSAATVTLRLYGETALNLQTFVYYRFGHEQPNDTAHWYRWMYQGPGTTGAEIQSDRIILHFIDGQRGDDDLAANGVIVDPGGVAFIATPLSPEGAFVTALYQQLLNRGPETAGLRFWVGLLLQGASRFLVAHGIYDSFEHRGIQVDQFYATYLHRGPDPLGRAFWVNALLAGAGETQVELGFLTSAEYTASHPSGSSFVGGLYSDVLGRPVDVAGQSLASVLEFLPFARPRTSLAYLTSAEAYGRLIDRYYAEFLGRAPDAAGDQFWLTLLLDRRASLESVAEAFLASDEYFARTSGGAVH